MKVFICEVCGHIEFNDSPDNCPVCFAPKEKFKQNDNVFIEAEEKSKEGRDKHIPEVKIVKECGLVPENDCIDILVRIGKILHPAVEEHFIQFIDCYLDDKYVSRIMLTADMNPSVVFHLKNSGSKVTIVEFCNKHGHWMSEAGL